MVSIRKFWIFVLVSNRIEYWSNYSIRFEISNIRTSLEYTHRQTANTQIKRDKSVKKDKSNKTWSRPLRRDDLGGRSGGNRSGSELAVNSIDWSDLW